MASLSIVVGILFVLNATALAGAGDDDPTFLLLLGLVFIGLFGFVTSLVLAQEFSTAAFVALIPEGSFRVYLAGRSSILLAAVVSYLIWDTVALWWLAPVAALPVYSLLMSEPADRRQADDNDFSGPLTSPDGTG